MNNADADTTPIEIYATPIEIYATAEPSDPREEFPPPHQLVEVGGQMVKTWRLCAWHDERTPPPGVSVTHIMCQMCFENLDITQGGSP